ncbi:DUF4123 domain-containing protein [Pectobacterium wasabiae]|uniref:DUF4123 domain-containing protein n=1 Tax=Pectobacterium wasabiae TaxID=55208 RepID=A0AAW3EBK3_9GAMM|nr:DUF4123 domain-containing protein [Pectobacterium wasabiae]AOR63561.1 hypothetical protein A7983_09880 [Pectobacterium wasabiae CFBP 3304]EJS93552.1 Hypothetical protein Y17_3320 [Pectobacterium wasabiae CFBP 3304]KFX02653.1 hypothetical protein JV38_21150 [Pectobacterium wasabiae]KGA26542.1 hypothetical protein KU73_20520 [Pectobacterium wasabiae]
MSKLTQWAIVDAAVEPELFSMLEQLDPPHASLYAEPIPEDIGRLAPHLVQVDDRVSQWLKRRKTPWGILLESKAEMKMLRQHLRKYLHVQIPNEEKPVFFRFYDPRNIWSLCDVLTEWELFCFMGPIEKVVTDYNGTIREENFNSVRTQFPLMAKSRLKFLKFSSSQFDVLNKLAEIRYVDELVSKTLIKYKEKIHHVYNSSNQDDPNQDFYFYQDALEYPTTFSVKYFVSESYSFCKENGIDDDHSICGLIHLFIEKDCYSLEQLPESWRDMLSREELPGYYRVDNLLKDVLGTYPS